MSEPQDYPDLDEVENAAIRVAMEEVQREFPKGVIATPHLIETCFNNALEAFLGNRRVVVTVSVVDGQFTIWPSKNPLYASITSPRARAA